MAGTDGLAGIEGLGGLEGLYTSEGSIGEPVLAVLFIVVLMLLMIFTVQRAKYAQLNRNFKRSLDELKRQDGMLTEIEEKIKVYRLATNQVGLKSWRDIEKELTKLSELPTLTETKNEIILKTHISKLKKDDVDVSARETMITISIGSNPKEDSKGELPIQSSYNLPVKIIPHNLNITYKGNTLVIRAPKDIS